MRLTGTRPLQHRELLANLTLKQLRSTYKKSVLGFGWSMVNPLVTILVYAAVFSLILPGRASVGDPSGLDSYGLFLAAGLLPWQFTSTAVTAQSSSIVSNQALVQKVYLPRWVFPAAAVLSSAVEFLIEMLVFLALLTFVWQTTALVWLPLLLVVMALHLGFLFGLGLLLSPLNVAYRDIGHLVGLVTKIWFWVTPIIYPLQLIIDQEATVLGIDVETLYRYNPMLWFIEAYRALTYDLRSPSLNAFVVMTLCAAGALLIGGLVFRRNSPYLAERL